MIARDFDLAGWDWKGETLKLNTQHPKNTSKFTDILDDNGLVQIVEEATRGTSTLNRVITNHPSNFPRTETTSDSLVY